MKLVLLIAANILALYLASYYIEGVALRGGLWNIALVGLAFSIVNFIVKPIVKLVLSPFILLSFGLLIIVINMAMLWVTDLIFPQLTISGIAPLFLATLLVGIVNFVAHLLVRKY